MVIRVLFLPLQLLVRQEIPFEGGHLILPEEGRVLMEPDIPHHVPATLPFLFVPGHKAFAHIVIQHIIQSLSFVAFSIDLYLT